MYRSVRTSEEGVFSMLSSIYTFGVLLCSTVHIPHVYVLMTQQYYCHTYCATVVMLVNTVVLLIHNSKVFRISHLTIIHQYLQTFLLIKFSMYIIIIPHFFTIASVINFLVVKRKLYYSNSIYYSDSTVPYTTPIVYLLPTHYLQN